MSEVSLSAELGMCVCVFALRNEIAVYNDHLAQTAAVVRGRGKGNGNGRHTVRPYKSHKMKMQMT